MIYKIKLIWGEELTYGLPLSTLCEKAYDYIMINEYVREKDVVEFSMHKYEDGCTDT